MTEVAEAAPADQIDEGCIALIRTEISHKAAGVQETLTQAREAREKAEADLLPVQEQIAELKAIIIDVQTRIAGLDAAIAGGDEDITAEIEARSLRPYAAEVVAARQARVDTLRRTTLVQLQQALTAALETEGRAREHLEDLAIAAAWPLDGHKPAMETAGYALWIKHKFAEILNAGDKRSPHWKAAKTELRAVLGSSGVGAELQTDAISAFRAGVPAAVAAGGASRSWPDGTHITVEPGRPPIVSHGKATPGDLAQG